MSRATLQTILLIAIAAFTGTIAAGSTTGLNLREFLPRGTESIRGWEEYLQPSTPVIAGDSSITIIEFSDFQCPFCARVQPTLLELAEKYPGRVRLLYRHLPLAMHPHAVGAAEASECAAEQETFVPYHDLLFAKQDSIGVKSWEGFAEEAGVPDIESFIDCVESERYAERVQIDMTVADQLGFTGTPVFIVNGRVVRGARPLEDFEKHIR